MAKAELDTYYCPQHMFMLLSIRSTTLGYSLHARQRFCFGGYIGLVTAKTVYFVLHKSIFTGSNHPNNILVYFENKITDARDARNLGVDIPG